MKKYILMFLTDSVEEFNNFTYPEKTWNVSAQFTEDEIKKLKNDKDFSNKYKESMWQELTKNII